MARWWLLPLVIVFLPVILAFGVLWLVFWLAAAFVLLVAVWIAWCPRRRNVLVVYSNSPIWQAWFEQDALPTLGSRAVVLNWSERKRWKSSSLAVLLFRVFGGTENFNPMVIVVTPFLLPRTFRFYRAFHDFKHGKPQEVERMWSEVLNSIYTTSKISHRPWSPCAPRASASQTSARSRATRSQYRERRPRT